MKLLGSVEPFVDGAPLTIVGRFIVSTRPDLSILRRNVESLSASISAQLDDQKHPDRCSMSVKAYTYRGMSNLIIVPPDHIVYSQRCRNISAHFR